MAPHFGYPGNAHFKMTSRVLLKPVNCLQKQAVIANFLEALRKLRVCFISHIGTQESSNKVLLGKYLAPVCTHAFSMGNNLKVQSNLLQKII
jgi:hypothetical protein